MTPARRSQRRMRWTSGSPATGSAALARTNDSGRRRVARPAVSTSAGIIPSVNTMFAPVRPNSLAVLDEEAAIGVEDEVGRRAPERRRHGEDALFAAFDLDERADRRLVERDGDVLGRELLAVLLVAEPDVQPELLEHALQTSPSPTTVSCSSRIFIVPGCTGPLNVSRLLPDSVRMRSDAAAAAERFVLGIEQRSSCSRRDAAARRRRRGSAARACVGSCRTGV